MNKYLKGDKIFYKILRFLSSKLPKIPKIQHSNITEFRVTVVLQVSDTSNRSFPNVSNFEILNNFSENQDFFLYFKEEFLDRSQKQTKLEGLFIERKCILTISVTNPQRNSIFLRKSPKKSFGCTLLNSDATYWNILK